MFLDRNRSLSTFSKNDKTQKASLTLITLAQIPICPYWNRTELKSKSFRSLSMMHLDIHSFVDGFDFTKMNRLTPNPTAPCWLLCSPLTVLPFKDEAFNYTCSSPPLDTGTGWTPILWSPPLSSPHYSSIQLPPIRTSLYEWWSLPPSILNYPLQNPSCRPDTTLPFCHLHQCLPASDHQLISHHLSMQETKVGESPLPTLPRQNMNIDNFAVSGENRTNLFPPLNRRRK